VIATAAAAVAAAVGTIAAVAAAVGTELGRRVVGGWR